MRAEAASLRVAASADLSDDGGVQDRRRTGIALALGAAAISGVSVYVNAIAVKAFGDPILYTTVKNSIAAVILIGVALAWTARGPARGRTRPRGVRELAGLGVVGLLGGGLAFALFFEGLSRTGASSAGFIQKTLVLWVAILAVTILRERLGRGHIAAIAVLLIGQIVVAGGFAIPSLGTGEALVFLATLLWAVEVVVAKRLLTHLSSATVAVARMGIGAIALIGFSVASGHAATLGSLGMGQWAWVLLTGVILSAYVTTWFAALARAQATDVTAVLVFGAVITAVLSSGSLLVPGALGLVLIAAGTVAMVVVATRSQGLVRQPEV